MYLFFVLVLVLVLRSKGKYRQSERERLRKICASSRTPPSPTSRRICSEKETSREIERFRA